MCKLLKGNPKDYGWNCPCEECMKDRASANAEEKTVTKEKRTVDEMPVFSAKCAPAFLLSRFVVSFL